MLKQTLMVLAIWAVPLSVGAQDDTAARIETAFRGWVAQVGAKNAVLSIWRAGDGVRDVGVGTDAQTAMPLASLGKAITGTCAATLVAQGAWQLDMPVSAVLPQHSSDITVAQLLTHSSGLGPDQTQGLGLLGLFDDPGADVTLAGRALGRTAQDGTPGTYAYNNENYAILGAMIAAHTGQSVVDYCRDAVLVPAGVTTAAPHGPITGTLSFGGWEMSAADYARFHWWAFGPDGIIGGDLGAWPVTDMGGGAQYGVGTVQRAFRGKDNFWHFGLLCFPERINGGSYVVNYMHDWRAVVAFDACVSWDQLFALDGALAAAVFP